MNETLILGGIVLLLWLVLMFLRVPSSIAFLSLLIGQLLSTEASADVYDFVGTLTNVSRQEYIEVALLLLPLLLTIFILQGRVAKAKIFIEAIPSLLLAALTILLLSPILSDLNIFANATASNEVNAYRSIIVIAASASGLLSAWLSYPKSPRRHHGKHGK